MCQCTKQRGANSGASQGVPLHHGANLLISHVRQRNVVPIEAVADLSHGICHYAPGPEQITIVRRRVAPLQDAIDCLPSECRKIVMMRRIDGLSRPEIVVRLGLSEHTGRARRKWHVGASRCSLRRGARAGEKAMTARDYRRKRRAIHAIKDRAADWLERADRPEWTAQDEAESEAWLSIACKSPRLLARLKRLGACPAIAYSTISRGIAAARNGRSIRWISRERDAALGILAIIGAGASSLPSTPGEQAYSTETEVTRLLC